MAMNLTDYLKEHEFERFNPKPLYFSTGDFVSYHWRDERSRAQRVDDWLTLYISLESDEVVGCKIKGVRHILKTFGEFGVELRDRDIKMGFLFIYGALRSQDDVKKKRYYQLNEIAKDLTFSFGDSAVCA